MIEDDMKWRKTKLDGLVRRVDEEGEKNKEEDRIVA